jgi:hypothetical protein
MKNKAACEGHSDWYSHSTPLEKGECERRQGKADLQQQIKKPGICDVRSGFNIHAFDLHLHTARGQATQY